LETKLQKWSRDEVKSARNIADSYGKLHRTYSNSAHKVNQINRDKKVQLSELAVAEKKRDDLLAEWEREGRVGLQSLEHIYDKSKSTLMFALAEFVQARLDMYSSSMATLTKIQAHLGELVHFATQQEALQRSSVVQLQSTIQREEKLQKEIDNAPRSLHPSLMSAAAASALYASRCPLQSSWDAKREGRSSKTTVGFDVRTCALSIGDASWHVEDILALTKAHKTDSTKVKITFVNREYKDEGLSFYSTKDREAFYEMFCLLRRGFANSFVASTQTPVTHEEVKIWTGSWNMGDAPPEFNNEQGMENWMPRNKFDFYVLGLQESEYTPRSGYLTAEDDFFSFMRVHLGDNYLKLAGVSLQHIRLVCFVSRDHYHKISSVKTATVATGLAGVIGNKGCAAISFSFFDSRFCFIGSHLAARIDRKRLEARNQNYRDILKGLANGFSNNGLSDVHHEFDYTFWLGDLNYRIDGISRDEIIAKAGQGDIMTLLKHDQLNEQRGLENCFLEFYEPDITFGPTYRFNRGDRTWSEEKMREPAFCDRVLYKTLPMGVVRPLAYQPCHDLMTSDHSPIYSTFAVDVYLPAMPHARDPMCKVTVKDVVGTDLRMVGGSNGGKYSIVLQAPWITNSVQVSAINSGEGEQPRWPNDIDLFPISTNRTYLASRWIRVVVRDGKVDVGVGIIYLEDALLQNGLIRWSANLADKGRFCGRLTGSLIVSFSPSYEDPWPFKPEFGILPSYFDLAPTARPTSASVSLSRATLSESDFKSKQSEHVIQGGNDDDRSISSSSSIELPSSPSSTMTIGSLPNAGSMTDIRNNLTSSAGVSSGTYIGTPPTYSSMSHSSPGSTPLATAKSTGRSWAASRSPRNPPPSPSAVTIAKVQQAGTPPASTAPISTAISTSTTSQTSLGPGSSHVPSPASYSSIGGAPSSLPSSNTKFMVGTRTPGSGTQSGEALIGARSGTSTALPSTSPASTHGTFLKQTSNPGLLGSSYPSTSSATAGSAASTTPSVSPRSPSSTADSPRVVPDSPTTASLASLNMNYSGGGIDTNAVRKSVRMPGPLNSAGSDNPISPDTSPSVGLSSAFKVALGSVPEQATIPMATVPLVSSSLDVAPGSIGGGWYAMASTSSNSIVAPNSSPASSAPSSTTSASANASLDDELAELATLVNQQRLSSSTDSSSRSTLSSAPIVIVAQKRPGIVSGQDDFARELAEFEELLNAKK
jgi:hypothetical protein